MNKGAYAESARGSVNTDAESAQESVNTDADADARRFTLTLEIRLLAPYKAVYAHVRNQIARAEGTSWAYCATQTLGVRRKAPSLGRQARPVTSRR